MKLLFYADIGGSGGFQRYCKGLLDKNSVPLDIELYLVISNSFLAKISPINDNIITITHEWMDHKSRIKRYLWHLWIFPRLINKIKPDIEFYANGHLRVYFRKAFTVATCHNLLLFDIREIERINKISEKEYFYSARDRYIRSFNKCNALIYLSDYSQKVISRQLKQGINNTVIAHGLDHVFKMPLNRNYHFKSEIEILYVSPIFHYKHQLEVVKAIKQLKEQVNLNVILHLVGGGTSSAVDELMDWIQKEKLNNLVKFTRFINTELLVNSYKSADLFVFASSCETFGITLLEAMGARLPIACSDKTGLNAILKDAGIYFDPENSESIFLALKTLIEDEHLRKEKGEKAYALSLQYSWEKCASETYNFIRSLKE